MYKTYRLATHALAFIVPWWLRYRLARGKEDRARLKERFGYSSYKRPLGMLVWVHAASVGEANSVLPLIRRIRESYPNIHLLMTTGTVTSARLMARRLPKGVLHHYVPIDTPEATRRFIRKWKPELALWVESELWPNLVHEANEYQCFMAIVNGRMSEKSFASWQRYAALIHSMLGAFDYVFAQSEADAERFKALGAKEVLAPGNMKFDGEALACDEAELVRLRNVIGTRPCWLAASTHPGEEEKIIQTHHILKAHYPDVLTLLVPRHPERGDALASQFGKKTSIAQRSKQHPITADTELYLADTLGELGLFYRLSEVVFMGGSLVHHGGQNPLEPARLACSILSGPYMQNFVDIYQGLASVKGYEMVISPHDMAEKIVYLWSHAQNADGMQQRAKQWVESKAGATDALLELLRPVLAMGQ